MKKLNCPSCGADMIIDPKTGIGVCKACGTKVQTADYTEIKTKRIIDEARIKEADVSIKKIEASERKRHEKQEENKRLTKLGLLLLVGAIVLCAVIAIICFVLAK